MSYESPDLNTVLINEESLNENLSSAQIKLRSILNHENTSYSSDEGIIPLIRKLGNREVYLEIPKGTNALETGYLDDIVYHDEDGESFSTSWNLFSSSSKNWNLQSIQLTGSSTGYWGGNLWVIGYISNSLGNLYLTDDIEIYLTNTARQMSTGAIAGAMMVFGNHPSSNFRAVYAGLSNTSPLSGKVGVLRGFSETGTEEALGAYTGSYNIINDRENSQIISRVYASNGRLAIEDTFSYSDLGITNTTQVSFAIFSLENYKKLDQVDNNAIYNYLKIYGPKRSV